MSTLLSLLPCEGMPRADYQQQFVADVLEHLPQLQQLETEKVGTINNERIILNKKGVAYSDVIGTWLYSSTVRERMESYTCR